MFDPPHPKMPIPFFDETLAVQRDPVGFEERNDFAAVEIAGHREHGGTCAADVVEDFAGLVDAAEVGQIAGQDDEVAVAHHLGHAVEVASRHVHVAEGDDLHENQSKLAIFGA